MINFLKLKIILILEFKKYQNIKTYLMKNCKDYYPVGNSNKIQRTIFL